MTDAKELRIGNLIYWNEPKKIGVPHEVILVSNQGMIHTHPISLGKLPDDYSPIELSEEWLLRFGFSLQPRFAGYDPHYRIKVGKSYFTLYVPFSINGTINYCFKAYHGGIRKKIDYVHELQNLFSALSGKELTIKP